jgi:hypothetical protein
MHHRPKPILINVAKVSIKILKAYKQPRNKYLGWQIITMIYLNALSFGLLAYAHSRTFALQNKQVANAGL